MPSYKILGGLLIVWATSEIGRRLAASVNLTVQIITDLIFALQTLESEINFAVNPLHLAAERVAKDAKTQAVRALFSTFASRLDQCSDSTNNLWKTTVAEVLDHYPLSDKDLELIDRLGHQLGLSNREDQIKHIRQIRQVLEDSRREAQEQCRRYQGLFRKVGVTIGLIIVLFSW